MPSIVHFCSRASCCGKPVGKFSCGVSSLARRPLRCFASQDRPLTQSWRPPWLIRPLQSRIGLTLSRFPQLTLARSRPMWIIPRHRGVSRGRLAQRAYTYLDDLQLIPDRSGRPRCALASESRTRIAMTRSRLRRTKRRERSCSADRTTWPEPKPLPGINF
jgi:hypothetical protein